MNKNNSTGNDLTEKVPIKHFLLIMRATLILLFTCVFCSMAEIGHTQNARVTINKRNATLKEVLNEIESQTDYLFIYNDEVNTNENVSVRAKQKAVYQVLNSLMKDKSLDYSMEGNHIIISVLESIKEIEEEAIVTQQQKRQISGKVVDEEGISIIGANIVEEGTTNGTITDIDGNFTLSVEDDAVIRISYIGYIEQTINIDGRTNYEIILIEDMHSLDELVVVGYGVQSKATLTGSVSSVSNDELTSVTTTDLRASLVGKLPGLRVMQRGGEPGSYDSSLDIRGYGGNPLVIIDGVPRGDFQKLDPNTIESISILKDASAAVYGVRAADGVILVKTKQGKQGKASISFTSTYGVQRMTEFPEPIENSIDNLILKNEAALVAGNPIPYTDYLEYDGSDPLKPNISYWDLTMKKWAPQTQNSVGVTGGTDNVSYYFSFSHLYDMGLFKSDNLKYERYNIKSNITAKIKDNLTANLIIGGLFDEKQNPFGGTSYDFFKQVLMQPTYEPVYYWDPLLQAFDETKYFDGEADRNPLAVIDRDESGYRDVYNKQMEITASLNYDVPFIEGLSLKGMFAYDARVNTQKNWRIGYKEYKPDGSFVQPQGTTRLIHRSEEWMTPHLQFSANYENSFNNHNLKGLLLIEQRKGSGNWFEAGRYFTLDILDQLNSGNTKDQIANGRENVPGSGIDAANRALVGRINYDFKSKYLMEFSFRYDGSSNFPKESRWGFFPAASLGWVISEEDFIKDNFSYVDNLKFRTSYGKMGDHSAAGNFQYVPGYNYPEGGYLFSGNQWTTGSEYRGITNPNITWYTATTFNIGVDAILWKNLLGVTVDYFQRERDGLLARRAIQIPSTFGTSLPLENIEGDFTRGFEIELSHFNKIDQVNYYVKSMISYTRTKWLDREATIAGNDYSNWRNRDQDRWKNIRWGYGYLGQFQTEDEIRNYDVVQLNNGHNRMYPGDIKYLDWNEDGMIDGHDEYPIGRGQDPEIFFSFNLGAEWKGLSITAFFQGATGNEMMPAEQLQGPLPWGRNSSKIFLDRWHHEDPLDFNTPWVSGKYPISRDAFGYEPNKKVSDFWLLSGTYLRLKNLEISYSLPSKWVNSVHLEQLRIFTNGLNLYTWSSAKKYMDPERPLEHDHGYKYPIMTNYNFGVSIIF